MKYTIKCVMALAVVVLLGATLRSPAPLESGCPGCRPVKLKAVRLMIR